jgi:hypothetical protein
MGFHQSLITEDRNASDGMHSLRMQEMSELGHIVNVNVLPSGKRVIERDIHAAVAVFDVEHHGISAHFAPMLDDADTVVTARHYTRKIDGPYFEILRYRDRFLDDRRGQNAGHQNLLSSLQIVRRTISVRLANCLG